MIRLVLAAILLAGLLSAAKAQDEDCGNAQSQAAMNECFYRSYEAADAELNDVWARLIPLAKESDNLGTDDGRPGHEETLRKAQRAWISFRDANCEFEGFQARGGTLEPTIVNSCLARLTSERTQQLETLLQEFGMQ